VFADLKLIYGWSIDATGNLTSLFNPISVTLTMPQVIYNQYTVITNPAGTLLFISEAATNQILIYQISSSGSLTPAPGSPFSTTDISPQNMGMDGLGKYLYVAEDSGDHSGSFMTAYSVSSAGMLTEIAGSPFNFPMWEMQGDPSGQFLIGISGEVAAYFGSDDDHIYVFSINSSTGAITPVANSPFATTNAPFDIAVQPKSTSGAFIYSFSYQAVNPVEGYQLNTTTGQLTAVFGSPFSTLSSTAWGQFDQSGNLLVFYNGIGASGGGSNTLAGLNAFPVSSSGSLGTTDGPGVTLATNGYWVITDVP
jgi:6-phosphogluconolactonase